MNHFQPEPISARISPVESDPKAKSMPEQRAVPAGKEPAKEPARSPLRKTMGDGYVPRIDYAARARAGQDPIAAALRAAQEFDPETDAEEALSAETHAVQADACRVCGHCNAAGTGFCASCGVPLGEGSPRQSAGQHHYHHHYHHHYANGELSSSAPAAPYVASVAPAGRDAGRARAPLAGTALSKGEAAVRQLTQDWVQACNTKHLDDLVELYAQDAMVLRPNVPPVRGIAGIREFFFSVLDAGLGEVEMDTVRTELFGEVAYEAGRCKMLVPTALGKRREERGKYLMMAVRQAGEWKIVSDCWSSDLSLNAGESEAPSGAVNSLNRGPRKG